MDLIKEIREIKEELCDTQRVLNDIENSLVKKDNQVQEIKMANKALQDKVMTLECKLLESHLKLGNVPEEKSENIHEITVKLISKILGEC